MTEFDLSQRLDVIVAAIDFIEEHLTDKPTVGQIAAACSISRTHLQRLFADALGESVGAYLRRRCLCRSLNALISTDQRILEIALEMGFQSQEAFTRAFASHFGLAPATFRKAGDRFTERVEPRLTRTRLELRLDPKKGVPRIESREAQLFVGVARPFVWGLSDGSDVQSVVPETWARFDAGSRELGAESRYGLTLVAEEADQKRGDEMLFMAAAKVPEVPARLPDGFSVSRAPAAEYAVFSHPGSPETFAETVRYALGDWRPTSEFEFNHLAAQVRSFSTAPDGSDEYWLPILPKGDSPPWHNAKGG